ncbi:hypothetical protein BDZ94DRAFT_1320309 [Collybia nuda]|uniref:Uncharacterized protein n=1 Tax=Collybia nuda TaxID=64659 RepID=A0A9P6CMA3_9AGAR|nr:hypothetical protein BDZ94DRAFT_1320309 [Collybia nuda]
MSRPLAYLIKHTNPQSLPLPRNSKELLAQGDYGIYLPDGSISRLSYHYHREPSLLEDYGGASTNSKGITTHEAEIRKRDGKNCSMTGALLPENNLEVVWIMPPDMFQMMPIHEHERVLVDQKFEMDPESRHTFMKPMLTRIAIDVDDDYRIFRFFGRDFLDKGRRNPLKTRLTFKKRPNEAVNDFLRTHFLYSLLVQTIRGDIADHYNEDVVNIFMAGNEVFPGNYDLERHRWETGIGLQVPAWLNGAEPLSWEEILERIVED